VRRFTQHTTTRTTFGSNHCWVLILIKVQFLYFGANPTIFLVLKKSGLERIFPSIGARKVIGIVKPIKNQSNVIFCASSLVFITPAFWYSATQRNWFFLAMKSYP
jgi:hypothetical protein